MSELELAIEIINGMIDDYENQKQDSKYDALDQSYFNCSIATLGLLKSKLGIIQDNV